MTNDKPVDAQPFNPAAAFCAASPVVQELHDQIYTLLGQLNDAKTIANCATDLHETDQQTIANLTYLLDTLHSTVKTNTAWLWAHPELDRSIRDILAEVQNDNEL